MSDWNLPEIEEIVLEGLGGVADHHTLYYEGGQLLKESAASNSFLTMLHHDTQNDFEKNVGNQGFKIETVPHTKEEPASCSVSDIGPSGLVGFLHATADAGLSFLENDKEGENDLSYYDWRDVNDFDEIDQIFRNCDPTSEQWSNTNSLSWLSSSSDLYGPEDAYYLGLPSSSSQLRPFDFKPAKNGASINSTDSSQLPLCNQQNSCSSYQSYELATDTGQVSKVGLPVKQCEGQSASKFKGKDQISISGSPLLVPDGLQQIGDQKHPVSIFMTPDPSSPFQPLPKQNHLVDSESSSYLPKFRQFSQANGKHPVYQDLFVHSSSLIIDNAPPSRAPSNYITNSISKNLTAFPDLTKVHDLKLKKNIQQPSVGSSELVMPVHDHCNNLQESSSVPSTEYDNSIKASSFKQLHNVVDQLDVRTKLCIRDSLYRLAKSAEKRHNFACTSNRNSECTAESYGKRKTVKSLEHMNIETETNPIDRFMAHLLFHGPQDPTIFANGTEEIDGPISRNQ